MTQKQASYGNIGVYNATPPTFVDGESGGLQLDASGNTLVSIEKFNAQLQALISGIENDSMLIAPFRRSDAFSATVTAADATSATQVKAKTASKAIYVTDIVISVDTAMNVQLQDDAGTPTVAMEQIYLPANSVWSKTFSTPIKLATNVDLDVITSAAGNISVLVTGYVI